MSSNQQEYKKRMAYAKRRRRYQAFFGSKFGQVLVFIMPTIVVTSIVLLMMQFVMSTTVNGHSMEPTLVPDERLVLVRDIPFNPIKRFDLVVAKEERDGNVHHVVKRVIGLPGDKIRYEDDMLTINGKSVDEPYLKEYLEKFYNEEYDELYGYNDDFKDRAKLSVAYTTHPDFQDNFGAIFELEVPKDGYFLMGDNRLVSKDSRDLGAFPKENIVGEVVWGSESGFHVLKK